MPPTFTRRINARSLSLLFIFVGLLCLIAIASAPLNQLQTTVYAGGENGRLTVSALPNSTTAQTPGAVSFSSDSYSVSESASGATITLKRAGGTDNRVEAKVTLTDVTTSPADYVFTPGALDNSFNPGSGTNSDVLAVAVQPDGKVIIGGFFTSFDGTGRNRIARLNPDGSLDASFNPGTGANDLVEEAVVQPDGKIIIGGYFTSFNGAARSRVARLNPDGSLDATFNPGTGADNEVSAIALQPDGRIVIGGRFANVDGTARNYIARLNSNGSLDTSFNPGSGANQPGGGVFTTALQPDGKVIIGGIFESVNGTARNNIARLNSDGSHDTSFNPGSGPNSNVSATAVQSDGRIIIGGDFNSFNGTARNNVARLNSNGSLDASFNNGTGPNIFVRTMIMQPDGKIIVGGLYTDFNSPGRDNVARLNSDGSPDASFNPGTGADFTVWATALQPDGRLVIGGYFFTVDDAPRRGIARLMGDFFVIWNASDGSDKTIYLPVITDFFADTNESLTLTLATLTGGATSGTYPTATLTIVENANSFSSVSGNGVFGGTATLTATLDPGNAVLAGRAVAFSLNGNSVGTATTDAGGVATLAGVNVAGINAGPHGNAVRASFAGDTGVADSGVGLLTVGNANQTITFGPLSDRIFGDADFSVSATASSGLSVSFTGTGNCLVINGSTVHITGAGSCTITASQHGDPNYFPAINVSQSFNVARAGQTITFGAPAARTYGDPDFQLSVSSSSGLDVGFAAAGNCALSGVTLRLTGAGSCTVTASQGGNSNYNAATPVQQSFIINKAGSTTTVTVANATFDGQPHGGAASVSGFGGLSQSLTVTYAGRNGTTYSSTTTAPTNPGDYTASASYPGGDNHTGSSDSEDFQIAKASQTITFFGPGNTTYGVAPFNLSATGGASGNPVTFSATGNCTAGGTNGVTITITGPGSCTITASQAGDANFNAASDVQRSFLIAKATTTTTVSSSANPSAAGESVTFTASVGSSAGTPTGSVQFKVDGSDLGTPVALGAGGAAAVTSLPLTQGSHSVTAVYSGDANFAAGSGALSGGQWALAFSVTLNFKAEGNDGQSEMDFHVTLSPANPLPVTVNYATSDGTAVAPSDYEAAGGQLFFLPGQTSKTITIKVNGDTAYEETEDFFVDISGPTNVAVGRARGLIINDDPVGGVIEFEQSSYDAAEGGSLTVKVKRTLFHSLPVDVDYTTDDGSAPSVFVPCSATTGLALDRCDFTKTLGTLHFAPGETEKTFKVFIGDDSYVEGAETLHLRLSNPAGNAALGPKSAVVVTINDDSPETAGNPIDDTNDFVKQQYLDFFSRDPDASGFQFWTGGITSCGADAACREVKRIDTSAAFFLSIEFQETGYLVYRAHKAAYGDALSPNVEGTVPVVRLDEFLPDTQRIGHDVVVGAGLWQQQLEANKQAYVLGFVQRPRFLTAFPASMSAEEFVDRLDQNAGGVLTAQERTQLVASLGATPGDAAKRASALLQVAENAQLKQREFNRAFVLMQYFGYLRRNPDDAPDADFRGWKFWLDKLDQFDGDYRQAEMVKAFITSDEYRKRFGQ